MSVVEMVQIAANVAVAGSFIGLAVQIYLSRVQRRHDIYERVNSEWIQHMSRILDDPELEKIWDEFDDTRTAEFEKEKHEKNRPGAAWSMMTVPEKKCYRYIRVALEIFEIAHQTRMSSVRIPEPLTKKWDNQIRVFLNSDYFDYVFEDTKVRLDDRFVAHIESLRNDSDFRKHHFGKAGRQGASRNLDVT